MSILRQLALRLYHYPGPTLNLASSRNLRSLSSRLVRAKAGPGLKVLNIGGGGRPLPADHVDADVRDATIFVDIRRTSLVHIVGDAAALPFVDGSIDAALSLALLEHVPDSARSVAEMHRVLKRGGLVYCEIPFLQVFHAAPSDYRRFTDIGIRQLFREFEEVELGVCVGPSSALSWMLREYLAGLFTGFSDNRRAKLVADVLAAWLTFPIKYLDVLFAHRPAARTMASAFYFLGAKK